MLRRLLCAYLGFRIAEFGVWIGLAAAAYAVGGVTEATAVMLLQLAPAALAAPSMCSLMRRRGATAVLRGGFALQGAGMAWCATWLAADATGPLRILGYLGAVVAAVAVTSTRPAMACLLPRIVGDDAALARANGLVGAADGVGMLVGPAVAGILLAGPGAGAVFAAMAGVVAGSLVLTVGLPSGVHCTASTTGRRSLAAEVRAIAALPSARVMAGLLALVSLLVGALDLLFVVTAVDVLGRSGAAAAWLNAAFGVGMVVGGAAFGMAARRRLTHWIVGGFVAWALVLLVLTVSASLWVAAAMLVGGGVGAACAEVASRTLLQRVAGLEQLGIAFSIVESTQMAALAAGTLSVGLAVHLVGPRFALVVPATVLLAAVALAYRAVARSEGHAVHQVVAVGAA